MATRLEVRSAAYACGCRGVRSCLLCEEQPGATPLLPEEASHVIHQCYRCGRVLPEVGDWVQPDPTAPPLFTCVKPCSSTKVLRAWYSQEDSDDREPIRFEGVTVIKDFISAEEESAIVRTVDGWKWAESQSGRRKQDFGPKVNFKRQKLKLGTFSGLPAFSHPLVERMRGERDLSDFVPVELCNLDYLPKRGSAIAPHRDDSWLWGERLVTLTLLSHTILSFSPVSPPPNALRVQVPLPQRSLVVVHGLARYCWLHAIHRGHIVSRRLAITLRELSEEFLVGGQKEEEGKRVLDVASNFDGLPTNVSSSGTQTDELIT